MNRLGGTGGAAFPTRRTTSRTRTLGLTAVALVAAAGLAGCSGSSSASTGASTAAAPSSSSAAATLTLADGWVRSKEVLPPTATGKAADPTMTGVFGTLTNPTDKDVTVTGGSSPAAGKVEMHETVAGPNGAMVMQPKQGGFVVPAKGTFVLKPGGNHIMLMELSSMPKIGTALDLTLQTSTGEVKLTAIPVRNFAGGDEKYLPATNSPSASTSTTSTP